MTTIAAILQKAALKLQHLSTPRLDAEVLLAHVLRVPRSFLYANATQKVLVDPLFDELIMRRAQHEPIAYLLGTKEFWSQELMVTRDVLIPRPETELLVEIALEKLSKRKVCKVLDLGTGSGAIALALKKECPKWEIYATDKSAKALDIAQKNALKLGLNIHFYCGDWFAPVIQQKFDFIISNPPYVADHDPHLLSLQFEPQEALCAGKDGLDAVRIIIANAMNYLVASGFLLVEHGFDQQEQVMQLMQAYGFCDVAGYKDLAFRPRAAVGKMGLLV